MRCATNRGLRVLSWVFLQTMTNVGERPLQILQRDSDFQRFDDCISCRAASEAPMVLRSRMPGKRRKPDSHADAAMG